jgi:hypothetical protein
MGSDGHEHRSPETFGDAVINTLEVLYARSLY